MKCFFFGGEGEKGGEGERETKKKGLGKENFVVFRDAVVTSGEDGMGFGNGSRG